MSENKKSGDIPSKFYPIFFRENKTKCNCNVQIFKQFYL